MYRNVNDDSVLVRTLDGQREAIAPLYGRLDTLERELLLVVNGITPLGVLLDLGLGRGPEVQAALEKLLRLGLVRALR